MTVFKPLLFVCGAALLPAQPKACKDLTVAIPVDKNAIYLRGPSQLQVERRKRETEENTDVKVYLEGVNPYRSFYSSRSERFPADEATIQQFLGLLGVQVAGVGAAPAASCNHKAKVDALQAAVEPLSKQLNQLVKEITALGKEVNALKPDYEKFLKDTSTDWLDPAGVPKLCDSAAAILDDLEAVIKKHGDTAALARAKKLLAAIETEKPRIKKALDDLNAAIDKDLAAAEALKTQFLADKATVKQLSLEAELLSAQAQLLAATDPAKTTKIAEATKKRDRAAELEKGIEEKEDRANNLKGSELCRTAVGAVEWVDLANENAKALTEKAREVQSAATMLDESVTKFKSLEKVIIEAHSHRDPLTYRLFILQTGSDSDTDRLLIDRTDLRQTGATPQQIAKVELIGIPDKFSLSGGIGISTLSDRKVVRRTSQGATPTADPITKFDYDSDSSGIRPAVLVLLNAHLRKFSLFEKRDATFALSSGIIGANRGEGTQLEYTMGPSLGLLRNKLFLNFGLHLAKVEKLAGGFNLGDEIPSKLQDPLPTKRSWKPGFMFSISYQFYKHASPPQNAGQAGR